MITVELNNEHLSAQENKEASDKLSLLVNETVKTIPNVEKIYLFGSYAYGIPNKDSDFDVMVLTETKLDPDTLLDRSVEVRHNISSIVDDYDMLVYSSEAFYREKEDYRFEDKIYTDGKVLYERV